MTNHLWFFICILVSFTLGIIYFTWLWLNTRTLIKQHSWQVWLLHVAARYGLLILCFYLLSGNEWQNWVACLIGWTGSKILISIKIVSKLNSKIRSKLL